MCNVNLCCTFISVGYAHSQDILLGYSSGHEQCQFM